jgi:hypothetical protein
VRMGLAALMIWAATGVAAEVVERSPRPPPNPVYIGAAVEAEAAPVAEPPAEVLALTPRPMPRPEALAAKVAAARGAAPDAGLDLSAPVEEPELAAVAPPSKKELRRKKRETAARKGSVCGVAAIKGEEISPIKSKVKGCGVPEAVMVTSVSGVRLSQSATIDCDTARALNTWVDEVLQPAYKDSVVELRVAAHYICRSRNNQKGARISEHGKGKAIDISAFVLANGKVLAVLGGFNKTMRRVYKGACGIFKTTLGPGSDGYHEDHLHFDTSDRRGGAYCR